jgi:hypothetical protein
LSYVDPRKLLVFARCGRTGSEGPYATCHSLNLPITDPGYFFWRDRDTGALTRRTEWFVTKTPEVWIGGTRLDYLLSFSIPRFCDQTFAGARKQAFYAGDAEPWLAKLDTVMHELYHIAPNDTGLRKFECEDGKRPLGNHGPRFLAEVAGMVHAYLATRPDTHRLEFLRHDFRGLVGHYGGVVGTTFRNFPSYPQRYAEAVDPQPTMADVTIVPIARTLQPRRYTRHDLQLRQFTARGARRAPDSELDTAA